MTATPSSTGPSSRPTGTVPPPANSGWVSGLVLFAGVIMLVNGLLDLFQGIVAVAQDDLIVTTPKYVFRFDLTSWGWIHIVLGLVLALVGLCVLRGMAWARYTGIAVASLSAIFSFLWLPYYPVWGLVVIALDVFVIWALAVYRED
ncbi:DUF7144 family membrane protein [Kitasatospora paranensis]|uniref:DUF7144 domain-containing protein n=1 Tax=Kitasatospora paranensis TaxID=258053 RepID=A0ABW2FMT1_9ACTN